ncbi:MAG: sugar transferase [Pseudanabaenaceae cyanobacterium bins.68]|nr:sugar transferase [Pseudanabaenaceae cyanobacterium bins.68]
MRDIRSGDQWIQAPEMGWLVAITTLIADLVALGLAGQITQKINRAFSSLPPQLDWGKWLGVSGIFWAFVVAIVLVLALQDFYSTNSQWRNYLGQSQIITRIYLGSLILSYFYDPEINLPRSLFFSAWLSSVACCFGCRFLTTLILDQVQRRGRPVPVFVIATTTHMEAICRAISHRTNCQVVGSLTVDLVFSSQTLPQIQAAGVKEVIAEGLAQGEGASSFYWQLRQLEINLRLIPSSISSLYRRGQPEIFGGMPVIRIGSGLLSGWDYRVKRSLDLVFALIGVIILAPLFLVVASLIKLNSPQGNVFFCQERVGLQGKVFQIWKFRTMYADAESRLGQLEALNQCQDGVMFKLKRDPRIIPVGHFLRRFSIDELPQLFNVILGQMSLVGPRPLPLRDVAKFSDWHHARHAVLPGITGLWQISGRSEIDNIHDAVRLDLFYLDQWSLQLDLEILFQTIQIVIFGKGAY